MCDTDYAGITPLRHKQVIIRKPQTCAACERTYPVGTSMEYQVSIQENEFTTVYQCQVCIFLQGQEEHSDLHVCWGDLWENTYPVGWLAGPTSRERYNYVAYCLENNEEPTLTGLLGVIQQLRQVANKLL